MATSSKYQALVATSKYLYRIDVASGTTEVINDKYGLFYGITWDRNSIYVAARWYPSIVPTSHIERPRLLVFDHDFNLIECKKFSVNAGGLHQITYFDDKLFCSCSREDSFIIGKDDFWDVWYPSADTADHNKDTHHFNSISCEDSTMLVVGHNNGPSDVWEFSYPDLELLNKYRIGEHAHNVWRENGILTVCNSRHGRVETVENDVLCEPGGFPRGAAIGREFNLIGVSDIANRSNRWTSNGCIKVYSKNWQLMDTLDLGQCGQVLEVRLFENDAAHNNDIKIAGS